jgi:hypothetical protein
MGVPWRLSADELVRILHRQGVDPEAVTDVAAAWQAFREFLQVEIEGLAPDPDADGFIVQWGRYSWHGGRLSISFTRQLAVTDGCDCGNPHEQPDYWQVDLALVYDDAPGLMLLDGGHESDTGFSFEPIGPLREAALAAMQQYEQLQAVLNVEPVRSQLSFERIG